MDLRQVTADNSRPETASRATQRRAPPLALALALALGVARDTSKAKDS